MYYIVNDCKTCRKRKHFMLNFKPNKQLKMWYREGEKPGDEGALSQWFSMITKRNIARSGLMLKAKAKTKDFV